MVNWWHSQALWVERVGLNKIGSGTLTLSGTSTYAGTTAIYGGTLAVTGGSLSGTGSIYVSNQAYIPATFNLSGGTVLYDLFSTVDIEGTGIVNVTGGTLSASGYLTSGDQPGGERRDDDLGHRRRQHCGVGVRKLWNRSHQPDRWDGECGCYLYWVPRRWKRHL